jgi:hypothetical protein
MPILLAVALAQAAIPGNGPAKTCRAVDQDFSQQFSETDALLFYDSSYHGRYSMVVSIARRKGGALLQADIHNYSDERVRCRYDVTVSKAVFADISGLAEKAMADDKRVSKLPVSDKPPYLDNGCHLPNAQAFVRTRDGVRQVLRSGCFGFPRQSPYGELRARIKGVMTAQGIPVPAQTRN